MRFLIDMNLSPGWVDYLTHAGHHAQHWSVIGPGDAQTTSSSPTPPSTGW
jgi:predicted nuclease of predicted toxin-antitoxin system